MSNSSKILAGGKSLRKYLGTIGLFFNFLLNVLCLKITNSIIKRYYKIGTLHKMADCNQRESILLKSESNGTLKMFALYPSLKEVLDNGGTLFVDELNARLNPLLVRNIILMGCYAGMKYGR